MLGIVFYGRVGVGEIKIFVFICIRFVEEGKRRR